MAQFRDQPAVEDIVDILERIWARSIYYNVIPRILIATYQQRNYLVASDIDSVFRLVGNKTAEKETYTVVRSKCLESRTKEDQQPIYSIPEKDALQHVCRGGLDDVSTFVIREIGPIYWSLESTRIAATPASVRSRGRGRGRGEESEEEESEEGISPPPRGVSRRRGTTSPERSTRVSATPRGVAAASPSRRGMASVEEEPSTPDSRGNTPRSRGQAAPSRGAASPGRRGIPSRSNLPTSSPPEVTTRVVTSAANRGVVPIITGATTEGVTPNSLNNIRSVTSINGSNSGNGNISRRDVTNTRSPPPTRRAFSPPPARQRTTIPVRPTHR
jgi:hypothetical protein